MLAMRNLSEMVWLNSKQATETWKHLTSGFLVFTVSANVRLEFWCQQKLDRLLLKVLFFLTSKVTHSVAQGFFADTCLCMWVNRNILLINLVMATAHS